MGQTRRVPPIGQGNPVMSSLSIGVGSAYTSYAMMSTRSVQQAGASDEPSPMAQMLSSLEGDEEEGAPATSEHSKAIPASVEEPSAEVDVEGLLEMMGQSGDDTSGDEGEFAHGPASPEDVAALLDSDGDGSIGSAEPDTLVDGYGARLSTSMSRLDTDGDATFSVRELQGAVSTPSAALAAGRRQADAFVQFVLGQYQSIAGLGTATTSLLDIAA